MTRTTLDQELRSLAAAVRAKYPKPAQFKTNIIQAPSGRWYFVGSGIPAELAVVRKDGKDATAQDYENAHLVGPAIAGMTTRTFDTEQAAREALISVTS